MSSVWSPAGRPFGAITKRRCPWRSPVRATTRPREYSVTWSVPAGATPRTSPGEASYGCGVCTISGTEAATMSGAAARQLVERHGAGGGHVDRVDAPGHRDADA